MSGLLSPAGVRTCLAATSPRSAESDLTALVLDIRPRLWFSFATAAALEGLEGHTPRKPYHITLARRTYVKRPDVVVHTSNELGAGDTSRARGFDVIAPIRTIIDLTPGLSKLVATTFGRFASNT